MIDFTKRLGAKQVQKPTDPIALYETLDRAHDKGPLRPAQAAILKAWHQERRKDRQADECEHVPVRGSLIIEGKQKVKCEDRQTEPEKVKNFELLPGPTPVSDHRPGEGEKEQRREGQEMPEEKAEQFERMNA